jgi:hypothetical protein
MTFGKVIRPSLSNVLSSDNLNMISVNYRYDTLFTYSIKFIYIINFTHCYLQAKFDSHLTNIAEMTEIGESVARVEVLIKEANDFERKCLVR